MKTVNFYSTKEKHPEAQPINEICATYYVVLIEGVGIPQTAMFLKGEDGCKDWYLNYTAKIIKPVLWWGDINSI